MQAVMVIPRGSEKALKANIAGVPLLVRVIATAMRAGVRELVLFWPDEIDPALWDEVAESPFLRGLETLKIDSFPFDPKKSRSWNAIHTLLKEECLWLPWNFVTSSRLLSALDPSPVLPLNWDKPVRLPKELLGRSRRVGVNTNRELDGVSIYSRADILQAERFLVAKSGKSTDGIYSTFNRKLSRPFVRALTHTRITPNVVTLGGAPCSGYFGSLVFARVLFVLRRRRDPLLCFRSDRRDGRHVGQDQVSRKRFRNLVRRLRRQCDLPSTVFRNHSRPLSPVWTTRADLGNRTDRRVPFIGLRSRDAKESVNAAGPAA